MSVKLGIDRMKLQGEDWNFFLFFFLFELISNLNIICIRFFFDCCQSRICASKKEMPLIIVQRDEKKDGGEP